MITLAVLLYIIAAICFFMGGISSYVNRLPAINWIAWGLLCWLVADKFLVSR